MKKQNIKQLNKLLENVLKETYKGDKIKEWTFCYDGSNADNYDNGLDSLIIHYYGEKEHSEDSYTWEDAQKRFEEIEKRKLKDNEGYLWISLEKVTQKWGEEELIPTLEDYVGKIPSWILK